MDSEVQAFKQSYIYKHKNNTDVAFYVIDANLVESKYYLTGYWLNIVNPNNMYMLQPDNITINLEDSCKWETM